MKTASLSLALTASLFAACGDNNLADGPQDPDGPDRDVTPRLDLQGTYRVHSTYDVATTMPGASSDVMNALIGISGGTDAPMSWVLDQIINKMDDGGLKSTLQASKPFVAAALNEQLHRLAPELVDTVVEVGQRLEEMTKNLGLNQKLQITLADQSLLARMTTDGVRFMVNSQPKDVVLAALNVDNVIVDGIFVGLVEDEARLGIGQHTTALPYGKILRAGLDVAVIPAIDETATSLTDLLDNAVDCAGVGADIAEQLDVGSASFWRSACLAGLQYAADKIYDQIADANANLDLHVQGTARAWDSNDDLKIDSLSSGVWTGWMTYDGTDADIAQPAKFEGHRIY